MTTETECLVLVCEPESVAEVLEEMQGLAEAAEAREFDITLEDLRDYAQRIEAAHARDAKDAARYRAYRATRVKPELFGGDGWSEEDTDRVIDAAMATPTREVIR